MAAIDSVDWRTILAPDSRSRITNKIVETLRRLLPHAGEEGISELRNVATRLEERVFVMASSQVDYLRRISLKMLTMEQNRGSNGSDDAFNIPPYDEL